jgi:hypothetical protein
MKETRKINIHAYNVELPVDVADEYEKKKGEYKLKSYLESELTLLEELKVKVELLRADVLILGSDLKETKSALENERKLRSEIIKDLTGR